jgi:hypothetical protein
MSCWCPRSAWAGSWDAMRPVKVRVSIFSLGDFRQRGGGGIRTQGAKQQAALRWMTVGDRACRPAIAEPQRKVAGSKKLSLRDASRHPWTAMVAVCRAGQLAGSQQAGTLLLPSAARQSSNAPQLWVLPGSLPLADWRGSSRCGARAGTQRVPASCPGRAWHQRPPATATPCLCLLVTRIPAHRAPRFVNAAPATGTARQASCRRST